MCTKAEIRKWIKSQKKIRSDERHNISESEKAINLLIELPEFKSSNTVLFYNSLPDELHTANWLYKISKKKRLLLPRVNGDYIDIIAYEIGKTFVGAYGIVEPEGEELYPINNIDIAVIPGVAFDKSGNRLGRGKGYYDRLLVDYSGIKIGICYDFQLIEKIPNDSHDIKMDYIITPNNVIKLTTK